MFISILIPTYNEAENIGDMLKRTLSVLSGTAMDYEILVIDDASADNTARIAEEALGGKGKVVRRVAKNRSLSQSVLDGIREAKGDAVVVMDADLSHPPELIPGFIRQLNQGNDLVIASRYVPGGGVKNYPLSRQLISRFACLIGRMVTKVKDNTSGFFCIKKSVLENVLLTPRGFKIGLEIFVKANYKQFQEVPYIFIDRKKGTSKLKLKQACQYFIQVISLFKYKECKAK
jgi:dolichol-phosphate mannosyltransferase